MAVTFIVSGHLADYGLDDREGIEVKAVGLPANKVSGVTILSNQPEPDTSDADGVFSLELVSLPGLWYRITSPRSGAFPPVMLAAYIPDPDDPRTGTAFAPGTVIQLADIANENPTPGYSAIALLGACEELTVLDNGDGTLTIDGTGVVSNSYGTITIGA